VKIFNYQGLNIGVIYIINTINKYELAVTDKLIINSSLFVAMMLGSKLFFDF